ncbi:cytochrome c oxidase assembly protein subunit 15 [Tumebacillus sp. BK434]|uniref:COX15/CtaA family protein n=1 Tax=Tumebacillus sp. BK434 TaxID=2512169 RepID=UPI0010E8B5AF|nr:heme A synthase [Tumebacillus sp. BK434]TCP52404.1 cytochrome c oxidase assembly protein subunit 15 [Tumebacillus sp. BK434]
MSMQSTKSIKWLTVFAYVATIVMFLVMIAGSLVTKTESGMGCGNTWPLCNGKWVPEYTISSMIEYMHRMITGVAGVVVLLFSFLAWWQNKGDKEVRNLALFGIFFILVESALGAAAVIKPQSSPVLALHFGFSLLAFTGVFLLTICILQQNKARRLVQTAVANGYRLYAWFVAAFAYGVVYLGAYVRHTGASVACPNWPLCQDGVLIPELQGLVAVHFVHRLGALTLFILVTILMVLTVKRYKNTRRDLYVASILAFLLITAQVISGGFVVLKQLHLYATLTHSAIITCLFGTLCYLCVQTLKKPRDNA